MHNILPSTKNHQRHKETAIIVPLHPLPQKKLPTEHQVDLLQAVSDFEPGIRMLKRCEENTFKELKENVALTSKKIGNPNKY